MSDNSLPSDSAIEGWAATPHRYWRRFFARWIDYVICMGAAFFVLQFFIHEFFERELFGEAGCWQFDTHEEMYECHQAVAETYSPFAMIIGSGLGSFLIAGLIASTGASIGKWIFGVRVLGKDMRPVCYRLALKREFLLWFRGFGLGLPIIQILTMLIAQYKLVKRGTTSWDSELGTIVYYRKTKVYWIALALLVGYLVFRVFTHALT